MGCEKPKGFLSDEDVRGILDEDIVICDYSKDNLTAVGYNLKPTEFVFSVNKGLLIPIKDGDNKKYCWVEPNDTVLILTREAVWVSEEIAGTFHSKVKLVSQGFGHISTTLDPNWEGPLLISLNNPTKKRLRFVLGENKGDGFEYSSFVTLIFYRMATPTNKGHDNLPCRTDILKNIVVKKSYINILLTWKYQNLQDVLNGIQYETIGIGSKALGDERKKSIEKFKKEYASFARHIEFSIRQAHSINREIIYWEDIGRWIANLIVATPLIWLIYLVGNALIKDDASKAALYAVPVSIVGILFNKIFKWGRE